jgi:hypothetical protein
MKEKDTSYTPFFIMHLKYIEYILNIIDNGSEEITVKQIRNQIKEKFKIFPIPIMLNHRFIPFQLLSILLIKEEENIKFEESDKLTISIIRHSIAHNNFKFDAERFTFINSYKDKCEERIFTYVQLKEFVIKIENIYFKEKFCE